MTITLVLINLLLPLFFSFVSFPENLTPHLSDFLACVHESLCSLIGFLVLRRAAGSSTAEALRGRFVGQLLPYAFPYAFLALSVADLSFGFSAYLLRVPPPRGYLPLIHGVPYLAFAGLLGWNTLKLSVSTLNGGSRAWLLFATVALGALSLFVTAKYILIPFHSALPERPGVLYLVAWLYSIASSLAFAALCSITLRASSFREFGFWFALLVMITADFELRYQDIAGPTSQVDFFELSWEFSLAGLAGVLLLCQKAKRLDLFRPLAPFFSLRVLTASVAVVSLMAFILLDFLLFHPHWPGSSADLGSQALLFLSIWGLANGMALAFGKGIYQQGHQIESQLSQVQTLEQLETLPSGPAELAPLISALLSLGRRLSLSVENNIRLGSAALLGEAAERLSHDIRSPLGALKVVLRKSGSLDPENQLILESAISRIQAISNDLLQNPAPTSLLTEPVERTCLKSVSESLLNEKKVQYMDFQQVDLSLVCLEKPLFFGRVQKAELLRTLSSLIDNAVDGIQRNGRVEVQLQSVGKQVHLSIWDNGKGIPDFLLPQLGQNRVSYGKTGGSGLGLLHARKRVNGWGGELRVESVQNSFTRITLMIPQG